MTKEQSKRDLEQRPTLDIIATPEKEEPAKAKHNFVSVGPGDSLQSLARLAYGDESRANDIFEANRDTLISPDSLQIGQTLRLPD